MSWGELSGKLHPSKTKSKTLRGKEMEGLDEVVDGCMESV